MRWHLAASVLAVFITSACGGSPAAPSITPTVPTSNLSGTVTSTVSGPVVAASMAILDGPNAGQQTITDSTGHYAFSGLTQAGFNVRASAPSYDAMTKGINLASNTVADFQLPRAAFAALSFDGELTFRALADGTFVASASGSNTGTACAGSVSGTSIVTSNVVTRTFQWALPASLIVRPGERFTYTLGQLSRADLGTGGTYVTTSQYLTVACL